MIDSRSILEGVRRFESCHSHYHLCVDTTPAGVVPRVYAPSLLRWLYLTQIFVGAFALFEHLLPASLILLPEHLSPAFRSGGFKFREPIICIHVLLFEFPLVGMALSHALSTSE